MECAFARRTTRGILKATVALVIAQILCGPMRVALADQTQPDPSGTATGDRSSAADAAGNPFVVPAPTDPSAPDYPKLKKDFDEYQAQAAREPLALKLADDVGHTRVATNFSWTLLTGYLVLFMQAGFALLTVGLVRKKNAGHLMMLNFAAYVFAFLAYYAIGFAFQFGAVALNAAPGNLAGAPTLNHFLIGSGSWGFLGGNGFFLMAGIRREQQLLDAVRSGVHGDGGIHHCRRDLRADHVLGVFAVRAVCGRHLVSDIWVLGLGWRLALAVGNEHASGPWICGFRGLVGGALDRRVLRDGAGDYFGAAPGEIWS